VYIRLPNLFFVSIFIISCIATIDWGIKTTFIWELLGVGAHIYICGNKQMGKDVEETIKQIVKTNSHFYDASLEDYMHGLKTNKRFQMDVW